MKFWTAIARNLLMLLACLSFFGQASAKDLGDEPQAKSVAAAMQQLHRAMIDADRVQLYALTTGQLTYGHSNGLVQDQAGFVQALLDGKPRYIAIDFQDTEIQVAGSTAWVRGILQARVRNEAQGEDPISFKILYVFINDHGAWKLLARQALKNP